MKKELRRKVNLGNCSITLGTVDRTGVMLKLTGREHEFKTILKLTPEQCKKIYEFITQNGIVEKAMSDSFKIEGIRAKHREYTKDQNEIDFTYKVYECDDSWIEIKTSGGYCMISLFGDKHYRTTVFRTHDVMDNLRILKNTANYLLTEYIMSLDLY